MTRDLRRRDFLTGSAALAGTTIGFSCVEFASAAPIEMPMVDKLSIRVLVDSTLRLRQVFPRAVIGVLGTTATDCRLFKS
jgi:hypothetical protein